MAILRIGFMARIALIKSFGKLIIIASFLAKNVIYCVINPLQELKLNYVKFNFNCNSLSISYSLKFQSKQKFAF